MSYATATLTNNSRSGVATIEAPIGFERVDMEMGSQDIQTFPLMLSAVVAKGELVKFSGGYVVAASATTIMLDILGVAQVGATGTASVTEIPVDRGILDGKTRYKVLANDTALTSATRGAYAMPNSAGRIMFSGTTASAAIFRCEDVINYTQKSVIVTLAHHNNT